MVTIEIGEPTFKILEKHKDVGETIEDVIIWLIEEVIEEE